MVPSKPIPWTVRIVLWAICLSEQIYFTSGLIERQRDTEVKRAFQPADGVIVEPNFGPKPVVKDKTGVARTISVRDKRSRESQKPKEEEEPVQVAPKPQPKQEAPEIVENTFTPKPEALIPKPEVHSGSGHAHAGKAEGESSDHPMRAHGGGVLKDEHGELDEHAIAEYIIIPMAFAIIIALFLGACVERLEWSWLPESAITLAVGAILGFYMEAKLGEHTFFAEEDTFNKTCGLLLTLFLLPVLVFEAGWSLRYKDFASQFEYIMVYAVLGSIISFLVVGMLIYYTGANYLGLHRVSNARTAFAFASFIAATDPVATLATYSKLKVDPLLNILVFGDSIFNDAVAIVLFKVLNNDDVMGTPDSRPSKWELSYEIVSGVNSIFWGSVAIGLLTGAIFLLLVRFLHMRDAPRLEIVALMAVAYISFAWGEVVHMSGIISTMFCSILLGVYARPHLSAGGSCLSTFFLQQMSCLMDTSVFLLTGFCSVRLGWTGINFGIWAALFCLVGRAASVFPLSTWINHLKRSIAKEEGHPEEDMHLVSPKTMFMIWHAGLRGAICLTLCLNLGPWVDELEGPDTRHLLQTATFFVIMLFLFVFGGTTTYALQKLEIPMGKESNPDELYDKEATRIMTRFMVTLNTYLAPIFIGEKKMEADIQRSLSMSNKKTASFEAMIEEALSPEKE